MQVQQDQCSEKEQTEAKELKIVSSMKTFPIPVFCHRVIALACLTHLPAADSAFNE